MNELGKLISFKGENAHRLARSNYIPRVLGFAASFLITGLLIFEKGWSNWNILFFGGYFLVYPHIVLLISKAMPHNKKVEVTAMMIDAFVLGLVTGYLNFFFWLSFAFLAATILNNILAGGIAQLVKSFAFYFLGIATSVFINGFQFEPNAALYIEATTIVSLLLYIIVVALILYDQTRRLAEIKIELKENNHELKKTLRELEETRSELMEKAHKAGMADVATGVIHNVGNILNSINVSVSIIEETLNDSRLQNLKRANRMLEEHIDDLENFIIRNPKGKKLMEYYLKVEEPLEKGYERLKKQNERLRAKVDLIVEIISAQQNFSKADVLREKVNICELCEETLTLHAGSIDRHGLRIKKDYHDIELVEVEKNKVMNILFNLIENAKEAINEAGAKEKKITVSCWQEEKYVCLAISDNGVGISKSELNKIFSLGYTTKSKGHGFGLHSCANYMKEMNGQISVDSKGPGKGATFTLSFRRESSKDISPEKNNDFNNLSHLKNEDVN